MSRGLALAEWEDSGSQDQEEPEMVLAEGHGPHRAARRAISHPYRYPIWSLQVGDDRFDLRRPIIVKLDDDEEEGVIVSSPELRMWGAGRNRFDALEDFCRTFRQVLQSYEETHADELTADAADYLRLLSGLIRNRGAR